MDARDELREASAETIRRLSAAVEARDTNTAAHIIGMSDFCFAIARELGLPPERCELLRAAVPTIGGPAELVTFPRLGHTLKPVLGEVLDRTAAFLSTLGA